jgi:hypothetical protein
MGKYAQAPTFVECDTAAVIIGLRYLGGRGGELKVWCSRSRRGHSRLLVLRELSRGGCKMLVIVRVVLANSCFSLRIQDLE